MAIVTGKRPCRLFLPALLLAAVLLAGCGAEARPTPLPAPTAAPLPTPTIALPPDIPVSSLLPSPVPAAAAQPLPATPPVFQSVPPPRITPTNPAPPPTALAPEPAVAPSPLPTPTLAPAPTAPVAPPPGPTPLTPPAATPAVTPPPEPTPPPTLTPALIPLPTALPPPTPTPPPLPKGMIIECVFFDGTVAGSEADEFVQVLNNTGAAVDLQGWMVQDISEGKPELTFAASFILEPGQRIRVYTNQQRREWGGFSFGADSPVWNNAKPDVAGLFNPAGHLISARTYPPGCE